MNRLLQPYAGILENAGPLLGAYFKGIARGLRPREPAWHEEMNVRRRCESVRVHPGRVTAFLAVTDGFDLPLDDHGLGGQILPPLFYTTWSLGPFLRVLSADELGLNLLGMVHTENHLVVHSPVRSGDVVGCEASLESLEQEGSRIRLTVLCQNRASGTLASESRSKILIRLAGGERKPGKGSTGQRPHAPPGPAGEGGLDGWEPVRSLRFSANLGRRYGLLVGDVNPIHLSGATARPFGFRRPIAHGFCLKAMVSHALIRAHAGGDAARLRELGIRFRRPVPLPSEALCLTRDDRFCVVSLDRARVHAEGTFAIARPQGSDPG